MLCSCVLLLRDHICKSMFHRHTKRDFWNRLNVSYSLAEAFLYAFLFIPLLSSSPLPLLTILHNPNPINEEMTNAEFDAFSWFEETRERFFFSNFLDINLNPDVSATCQWAWVGVTVCRWARGVKDQLTNIQAHKICSGRLVQSTERLSKYLFMGHVSRYQCRHF